MFYFCLSCALYRPLASQQDSVIFFHPDTEKYSNYNLVLNDNNYYHGTHARLQRAHPWLHTLATIIYWASALCQVLYIQWSLIILQLWKTEDIFPDKPAQVTSVISGRGVRFVTSSSPKLMFFLLYSLLTSHMNPLIPVPSHGKSSTSLYFNEKDTLCFYCAEAVWKVKHQFVHPSALQFLGMYFSSNQGLSVLADSSLSQVQSMN